MVFRFKKGIVPLILVLIIAGSTLLVGGGVYGGIRCYQGVKLVKDADKLAEQGNYQTALNKYNQSLKRWRWFTKQVVDRKIINAQTLKTNKDNYDQGEAKFGTGEWEKCKEYFALVPSTDQNYTNAQNRYSDCQKKMDEAANTTNEATTSISAANPYEGWLSFAEPKTGLKIRYPSDVMASYTYYDTINHDRMLNNANPSDKLVLTIWTDASAEKTIPIPDNEYIIADSIKSFDNSNGVAITKRTILGTKNKSNPSCLSEYSFIEEAIIDNGKYRMTLNLSQDSLSFLTTNNLIVKNNPASFAYNSNICSITEERIVSGTTWKSINSMNEFYGDMIAGRTDPVSQKWYQYFEKIINSINQQASGTAFYFHR